MTDADFTFVMQRAVGKKTILLSLECYLMARFEDAVARPPPSPSTPLQFSLLNTTLRQIEILNLDSPKFTVQ